MPNYNAIITEFQQELKRLAEQKAQLERQIAGVMAAIDAIQVLALEANDPTILPPPPMPESEGFTERVRAILRANPAKALTAVEIRDVLLKSSPKEDSKIMLIHTHNTLKRLKKQDEVDEVTESGGRVGYRWKPQIVSLATLAGMATDPTTLGSLAELGTRLAAIGASVKFPHESVLAAIEERSKKKK